MFEQRELASAAKRAVLCENCDVDDGIPARWWGVGAKPRVLMPYASSQEARAANLRAKRRQSRKKSPIGKMLNDKAALHSATRTRLAKAGVKLRSTSDILKAAEDAVRITIEDPDVDSLSVARAMLAAAATASGALKMNGIEEQLVELRRQLEALRTSR